MATIYEKNNHRFTLLKSNGESIFLDSNLDFYDIRRVNEDNEDGFYYRLFINPSSFYLYHIKKGRFLMHENGATCTISNHAARFNKIENYSQNTKTFIAHLADSNSKCLIKDVESILVRGFRYIGIESSHNNTNGYSYSRPVQLHEQTEDGRFKNIFFDCEKFDYAWKQEDSYKYEVSTHLGKQFNNGYFSIYNSSTKSYTLAYYKHDLQKNKYHKFSGIEYEKIIQYHKSYLICRIKNTELFNIYNTRNYIENESERLTFVGDYSELRDGLLMFTSLDRSNWILFKTRYKIRLEDNIIENINWTIDKDLVVIDDFIFHGDNDKEWKIYSSDGQRQYYTGWNNIKIIKNNNKTRIFVDSNEQTGHEVVNISEEVKTAEAHFFKRSEISEAKHEEQKIEPNIKEKDDKKDDLTPTVEISIDKKLPKSKSSSSTIMLEPEYDKLPSRIDYVTIFVETKRRNNRIDCSRKKTQLKFGNIILFIDETKQSSYCCEFKYNSFQILWHKNNLKVNQSLIDTLYKQENKKAFHKIDLTDFNENNLYNKVEQKLNTNQKNKIEDKELIKFTTITNFLKEQKFDGETVDKVMAILMPNFNPTDKAESKAVRFTFNENDYILVKDQQWLVKDQQRNTIGNPFGNKRFLRKKDAIIVWVDGTVFNENPYSNDYDYEMYGEGNDAHEDQFFMNNSNTEIRDGKKRILLFKKEMHKDINDPIFLFYDEVECIGYDYIHEDDVDSRKIINFHLKSKFRIKQ